MLTSLTEEHLEKIRRMKEIMTKTEMQEIIELIKIRTRIMDRIKGLKIALDRRKKEELELGKGDESYRLFLLERIVSLSNEIKILEPYLVNEIVQELGSQ